MPQGRPLGERAPRVTALPVAQVQPEHRGPGLHRGRPDPGKLPGPRLEEPRRCPSRRQPRGMDSVHSSREEPHAWRLAPFRRDSRSGGNPLPPAGQLPRTAGSSASLPSVLMLSRAALPGRPTRAPPPRRQASHRQAGCARPPRLARSRRNGRRIPSTRPCSRLPGGRGGAGSGTAWT